MLPARTRSHPAGGSPAQLGPRHTPPQSRTHDNSAHRSTTRARLCATMTPCSPTSSITPAPSLWGMTRKKGIPTPNVVLPLLHVTRIDTRGGNADANLTRARHRCCHLSYYEDVGRRALLLVPSSLHERVSSTHLKVGRTGPFRSERHQSRVLHKRRYRSSATTAC